MQQERNEPTKKRSMLPILGVVLGLALAIGVALWLFLPLGEPTPEEIAKAHIDGNIDEIGEEVAGFLSVGIPVVGKVAEELGGEYLEALIHDVIEWDYSDAKLAGDEVYEVEATALVALELNVPGLVDGDLDASMPFLIVVDMNKQSVAQRIPLVSDATVNSDLPGLDGIAGIAGIGGIASVVSTGNGLASGAPTTGRLLNTLIVGEITSASEDKPTQSGSPTPAPIATATPASPFGGHSVLSNLKLTPTPTPTYTPTPTASPTPIPRTEIERHLEQRYAEELEWCRFRVLTSNDTNGHVWQEFKKLDPNNMTDLQRYMWRDVLRRNDNCWPYFAERLSADNAHKRNWHYQAECFNGINGAKNWFYINVGKRIHEGRAHQDSVNQYARIMNFLELTGPELMAMEVKPYELYLKLRYGRNYNPAHVHIRRHTMQYDTHYELTVINYWSTAPYEDGETPISKEWLMATNGQHAPLFTWDSELGKEVEIDLTVEQLEWYGFGSAFQGIESCIKYYPQMFTGYWIPEGSTTYFVVPISQKPELEDERDLLIPDRYRVENYVEDN